MDTTTQKLKSRDSTRWATGVILRNITGWAFLAAAIGALLEVILVPPSGGGTIGLIPLYFGIPIGAVGFVIILRKSEGWAAAVTAAVGFSGFIYFMGTYPDNPEGWIGLVLVGAAHLFIPMPGRIASILWVSAGILAFPHFHASDWGFISGWNLFIAAAAATGLIVLLGKKP
jgi:hypothetical protein